MIGFDPPLVPATLLRRYKRFLADVRFDDGAEAVAHVPNSGAMLGVSDPGARVWLSPALPGRKLDWTLRFVETPTGWAGVDTMIPNRLVKAALTARALAPFAAYPSVRPEVRFGAASRVDFLLEAPGAPPLYLEVKNCHLSRKAGLAEFPDCVAARSAKHMAELADMVTEGADAAVLFVVQRNDCERFTPAADLDPGFAAAARSAQASGVRFYAFDCVMTPEAITFRREIPVDLSAG
jgi:sugar fermentation stimulation protein A